MRGIVLKNHDDSTVGLAAIVQSLVPGLEVFGGIALNRTLGGINPAAVEHVTKVAGGRGRIVWMPTFDSENGVRVNRENRPFVPVARDGALLPEVREVIALIAKTDLALATGHSSPAEALMQLREGRRLGLRRMVVTHAMFTPVLMDVAQMKEAATLGAFLESQVATPPTPRGGSAWRSSRRRSVRSASIPAFSRPTSVRSTTRCPPMGSVRSSPRCANTA